MRFYFVPSVLLHHTPGFVACTIFAAFFFFFFYHSWISHSQLPPSTLSQLLSRIEHNLTETLLSSKHTHTYIHSHTHILMECRLIHHICIKSIENNCKDLYRTQLLLPLSTLHYFSPAWDTHTHRLAANICTYPHTWPLPWSWELLLQPQL